MNRRGAALFCAVLLMFAPSVLRAQDVTGRWQGTLDAGKDKLRTVIQIDRGSDGALKGEAYSIDQTPTPQAMSTVSFTGSKLKFTVDAFHVSYEGTMSSDGKMIAGTMTQKTAMPLNLERATPETAWKVECFAPYGAVRHG